MSRPSAKTRRPQQRKGQAEQVRPAVRAAREPARTDEVELELTQVGHSGEAIGRWHGKVVFVPYAIPGERVRVRIVEDRKDYARGQLAGVVSASPDRVEPPCPYFDRCGGCQWQHIAYERQLGLHVDVIADQMRRLAHIADAPCEGIVPAPQAWAYRNNVQLHASPSGALGYVATDGSSVVSIESCPIAHDLVDELIAALEWQYAGLRRLTLRAGTATGEQMLLMESEGEETPELELEMAASFVHLSASGRLTTLAGSPFLHERLHERTYRVSGPSFFQVNTAQAENLVEVVQEYAALQGGERLLDLFSGVGTFSLALAGRAAEVIAVESSPWSAADAEANGEGVGNFTILEGSAGEVLPRLDGPFQAIVVDPPRSGCGKEVIEEIARLQPERLIYVSCDTATLARDSVYLHQAGLRLERMVALDMFPQTAHVETVARFIS